MIEDGVPVNMASHAQIIIGQREREAGGGGAGGELGRRLVAAARDGDTGAVRALLALGAPLATDWVGTSALHVAAAHDRADTVAALVRAGVSRDARTKVERTPLHVAAAAGAAGAARALLEHGAEVDCRDMLAMTPLHWAAERGHAEVAALLLRHGADPAALSKFLKTPQTLAQDPATRRLIDAALSAAPPAPPIPPTPHDGDNRENANDSVSDADQTTEETATQIDEKLKQSVCSDGAEGGSGGEGGGAESAGARLLRAHGIAPLADRDDAGGTLLAALHSGRTIVLSDAGKLMLRESRGGGGGGGGVVLTATPVRAPPRPPGKVFTLAPRQPPAPAPAPASPEPAPSPGSGGEREGEAARPTVKIIMNRANFTKLVGSALRAHGLEAGALGAGGAEPLTVTVPERFVRSASPAYLRSQLVAAHAAIHALAAELGRRPAAPAAPDPPPRRGDLSQ